MVDFTHAQLNEALLAASANGNIPAMCALLEMGVDPNEQVGDQKQTAAAMAMMFEQEEAFDVLLQWPGMDINQEAFGLGPLLQGAIGAGKHAFALKLIEAGADIAPHAPPGKSILSHVIRSHLPKPAWLPVLRALVLRGPRWDHPEEDCADYRALLDHPNPDRGSWLAAMTSALAERRALELQGATPGVHARAQRRTL